MEGDDGELADDGLAAACEWTACKTWDGAEEMEWMNGKIERIIGEGWTEGRVWDEQKNKQDL